MEPTLSAGDRLLVVDRPLVVERLVAGQRVPGRRVPGRLGARARAAGLAVGDIVALADPESESRVLVKRIVSIEGRELRVEGDNREGSRDSRSFGAVDRGQVMGRAVYRYFPAARAGRLGAAKVGRQPRAETGSAVRSLA